MPKAKWYSPQLSREIVSRLYHRAKIKGVSMVALANEILEQALDSLESIEGAIAKHSNTKKDAE
jgi:hypothetical protein